MGVACSTNGDKRNAYRLLVGKRPLGRPRHRRVGNIEMDLGEVGWGDVDWIGLAEDRDKWRALVNAVMNFKDLQNAVKLSSVYTTGGLSSSAQFHRVSRWMDGYLSCLECREKNTESALNFEQHSALQSLEHVLASVCSLDLLRRSEWENIKGVREKFRFLSYRTILTTKDFIVQWKHHT
jgi:hypothetical protein